MRCARDADEDETQMHVRRRQDGEREMQLVSLSSQISLVVNGESQGTGPWCFLRRLSGSGAARDEADVLVSPLVFHQVHDGVSSGGIGKAFEVGDDKISIDVTPCAIRMGTLSDASARIDVEARLLGRLVAVSGSGADDVIATRGRRELDEVCLRGLRAGRFCCLRATAHEGGLPEGRGLERVELP